MVEWKKLGEIVKRNKGIPITASQMSELASFDGNVRVFAAGQTVADIDESLLPANCSYNKPSIIIKSRGYIDFEYYDKPFTHKNEMWSYSFDDRTLCKFIFYYLTIKTEGFRKKARANSVKLPQLCVADTDDFLIPIPSLSEQTRIVGILDTFTASIENLKQQIAQRRKQYEHYRDQLLDMPEKKGAIMKTLGEACKIERGVRVVKKDLDKSGDVPVFQNSLTPLGYYVKSNNKGGTPFVIVGGAAGDVGYSDIPFWAADDCLCINESDSVVGKYIYAVLQKKQHYLKSQVRKAGVPRLSRTVVEKLSVSIPSLADQHRIVSILDTFEASIQNLEAQLTLREKQYEYYRNKLLTFD